MLSKGTKHAREEEEDHSRPTKMIPDDAALDVDEKKEKGDLAHWGGLVNVVQNASPDGKDEQHWPDSVKTLAELLRSIDRATNVADVRKRVALVRDVDWANSPLLDDLKALFAKQTPLDEVLTETKSVETAAYLLDRGADVHARDEKALFVAVLNENTALLKFLLEKGANVHAQTEHALKVACLDGSKEVVRILLDHGADVNVDNTQTLFLACFSGHKEVVRLLLDRGAKVNRRNLDMARHRNTELFFMLLGRCDDKSLLNEAFTQALKAGHMEVIKLLIERGVDANNGEGMAIIQASRGSTEMVQFLLAHGANPNVQNGRALASALDKDQTAIVRLLIEHGANANQPTYDFPLSSASANGNTESVRLLLDHGADVHAGEDQALVSAAQFGHKEVVKLLLDAGANPNAQDGRAIISASQFGHEEVVKLLLDAGANPQDHV
jgi:ankyrin repeat protein